MFFWSCIMKWLWRVRYKSVNTPSSQEWHVVSTWIAVQLYPQPLYTASQVRTTCRSWDEGVLTDVCLTGVLTELCLTLYINYQLWWADYYLFIKYYSPLHVSSLKCSSSGGYGCTNAAYVTVTLYESSWWPVGTQLEWELTVLTQTVYPQATRNSHREWQYHMLHV